MEENERVIPAHIAVILDGNGRYAKAHGLPRRLGHKAGCENLEEMVHVCADLGVKYFTVYGFSTENWKRSEEEVSALMALFRYYVKRLLKIAKENNVKCVAIGRRDRFDADLTEALDRLERETAGNTRMVFVIAIDYGARDELARAVRRIVSEGADPSQITEETVAAHLDTAGIPDPDLLIRTGGEQRISNFLLWQCAYTEFYYTDAYWPEFRREQLLEAIDAFNGRERRFGGRK